MPCGAGLPWSLGRGKILLIKRMAKNGMKVVLRADIGRLHEDPNVDAMDRRLANLFQEINPDWLFVLTLDEEHIFWSG